MQESMICAGDVLAEIVSSDILEGEEEHLKSLGTTESIINIKVILC